LTDDDYKQALEEKAAFKKFLEKHVLTEGTVMLLPGGGTDISYRDEYSGFVDAEGLEIDILTYCRTIEESGRRWRPDIEPRSAPDLACSPSAQPTM